MPTLDDYGFNQYNRRELETSWNEDVSGLEEPLSEQMVDVATEYAQGAIGSYAIGEVSAQSIRGGTIYSQKIFINVSEQNGDSFIACGKTDFTIAGSGWIIGMDDSDGNAPKFYIGDSTNYMFWTAADGLVISGSLVAGEIHIPDVNTTANSFHVESDGSLWMGATSTNRAVAPIQITPAGVLDVGNAGGNYIRIDGPNKRMGTSNFSAGVRGWRADNDGNAEFESLVARGILKGTTFQYDQVSAIGGQLLVTNADVLDADMTALDSSTLTIKGTTTFAVNDILLIRATTALGIQEEYFRVTNAASAPVYTVTRDLAATYAVNTNPIWQKGTTVVKVGKSDGAATYSGGYLQLIGEGTNSPYYAVYERTGVAYNAFTERIRLGNLNGIGSFVSDTYGIFIGDYISGQYLSYDTDSGELIINGFVKTSVGSFGGTGEDGDLTVSSDTTLNPTYKIFNYDNLTIDAGFTLSFGANFQNKVIHIKVKGDCVINGTLSLKGAGSLGGAGGTGGSTGLDGADGSAVNTDCLDTLAHQGVKGLGDPTDAGGAGGAALTITGIANIYCTQHHKIVYIIPGVGGGGGAGGNGGGSTVAGGAAGSITALPTAGTAGTGAASRGAGGGGGGAGGGALILEVAGDLTIGAAGVIDCSGQDGAVGGVGANASGAGHGGGGGGGGGGGTGGMALILYNGTLVNSGTINVAGGAGGNGGNSGLGISGAGGTNGGGGGGGGGFYSGAGGNGGAGDNGAGDNGTSGSGGGGGGGGEGFAAGPSSGGTGGTGNASSGLYLLEKNGSFA